MYKFGSSSRKHLNTCHSDLQKILSLAISRTRVDFGISEGHRSLEYQKIFFDKGKSTIDGISRFGKHNYTPSMAADLYVYHPDRETREKIAYDKVHLAYIIGVISSCAVELLEWGKITHKIRWGGNWDSDGVLVIDQKFQDLPHIELI